MLSDPMLGNRIEIPEALEILCSATTIFPKYSINQLKELKILERGVERAILPERANIKKQKK